MSRRILQLTDSLSRLGGGVAESVRGLTRGLVAEPGRRQISLAAIADGATSLDRALFDHLDSVETFPAWRIGPLKWSRSLTRHLSRAAPDLIHLHGLWGPASRALAAALRRGPVPPFLVSPHGMLEPWAMKRGSLKRFVAWRIWEGSLLRRAACLHALCTEEWLSLRALGLENPVALIPNGIDLPAEPVATLGDPFLFLGRLHPKKGLAELLNAWALLPGPPPLRIAGWDDGGHLERLRRLRDALGLADRVEFTGPAFGEAKERLFRQARAVILPSHSEGLPMTVLEAWAYGLPVLMSDHCHLPEGFARRAAVRVEPIPFSIADGVRYFLGLPVAEQVAMGRRGRELVAAKYSWAAVAGDVLSVYEWMLGGPQPSCVQ